MNTEAEKGEIQPKKVGTPLQELTATITHGQLEDEELQELISSNWPKVVGAVVLIIAGVWVYEAIQTNRSKIAGETSSRYSTVQDSFRSVYLEPAKDGAESKEFASLTETAKKALSESAKSIIDTGNVDIYGALSGEYLAVADLLAKNPKAALEKVTPLAPERFFVERQGFAPARVATREDLSGELASLLLVRALYESGETSYRQRAERLARNALFVTPETLVFLARTAEGEEERQKVRMLGEEASRTRPELREIIGAGLSPYGLSTGSEDK